MRDKRIADNTDKILQQRKTRRNWMKAVLGMAAAIVCFSAYLTFLPAVVSGNNDVRLQAEEAEQTEQEKIPDNPESGAALLSVPEDAMPLSEAKECTYSVTLKSGDEEYTEGENGTVSTRNLSFTLSVSLEYGWQDANNQQKTFYYQLPDDTFFYPGTYDLTLNGVVAGSYELTEDGYCLITIYDYAFNNYSMINLGITRAVYIRADAEGEMVFDHGPTITVSDDTEIDLNVQHDKQVTVSENPDGSIDYEYTLTVTTESEPLPELYIKDTLEGIALDSEDIVLGENYSAELSHYGLTGNGEGAFHQGELEDAQSLVVKVPSLNKGVSISAAVSSPTNTENGSAGFLEFYVEQLPQDYTLTVRYSVTVTADTRIQADAGKESFALDNSADFYCFSGNPENTYWFGNNSTHSPYQGNAEWLQKEIGETSVDSVLWNLSAGTDRYTMNGMYVVDEIERHTYELGVHYLTDASCPAKVKAYNTATGEEKEWDLEWVEVVSVENLTDEQKQDNTKIYWHENSFVWYPGTGDANQEPYTYTLTYYTTYVKEVFELTDNVNGAYVFYKGQASGIEPEAPALAEISLAKGLEELSDDGTVRYVTEIHSNGRYAADHFALYDYMPMTTTRDGDRLSSHERLTGYVREQEPTVLAEPSLEAVQSAVAEGETVLSYAGKYILLFDSVADLEEISGIHFQVVGDDGAVLDKEEMLAQGNKKIVFFFNAEPFPEEMGSRYAYIFGLQFNTDVAESTGLLEGLPDSAGLRTFDQGYTIKMSYETDAHRWGDVSYAGKSFLNRQEMFYRIPEISTQENILRAEAYYYFDALSDSSILNKYISKIDEAADGTVTITYTVFVDFSKIDLESMDGVWLYDSAGEQEGLKYADFSSVADYESFMENAKLNIPDAPSLTLEFLMDYVEYVDAGSIKDDIVASMGDYSPVFALHFSKVIVDILRDRGFKAYLSYPVTIEPDKIFPEQDGSISEQKNYNLRNFVRLYAEDSDGNQSPVSESWVDYGIAGKVLGKFQTQRPAYDNNYIADWRIVIDPDKLEPEDSDSFTVRDSFGTSQTLLVPSIKVYGVDPDGNRTEMTAECMIDTAEEGDTMLITVDADGDGVWKYSQYVIEYQTKINGTPGETVTYDNTAEIVGMESSREEIRDKIFIAEIDASIISTTYRILVNKYDANDAAQVLSGAKFDLYALPYSKQADEIYGYTPGMTAEEFLEINSNNWKLIASGETGTEGTVLWQFSPYDEGLQYIGPGTLFCLKETEAPDDYITAALVYGFIRLDFPWALPGPEPEYLSLFNPFTTITDIAGMSTAYVSVADVKVTSLEIRKTDDTGAPLEGAVFGLYSDPDCTELIRRGTEIRGGIHKFGNLTLESGTYYLKEITAPDGYRPLESAIEIVVGDEGAITVTGTSDEWEFGHDAGGCYIEVINRSGYVLPETGGTGSTLYIAGGTFLILISGAVCVKKRRKGAVR